VPRLIYHIILPINFQSWCMMSSTGPGMHKHWTLICVYICVYVIFVNGYRPTTLYFVGPCTIVYSSQSSREDTWVHFAAWCSLAICPGDFHETMGTHCIRSEGPLTGPGSAFPFMRSKFRYISGNWTWCLWKFLKISLESSWRSQFPWFTRRSFCRWSLIFWY
jgi:hypothetical protein